MDPCTGTMGPGPGSGTSTLEGAGDYGSGSYVTSIFGDHRMLCMHCQQGLGTEGRPWNEEQEQCFDKAAVTGITTRMSSHMQTNLLKSVGKAIRAQKSDHSLTIIFMGLSDSCPCRHSGSRSKTCKVLTSQIGEGPKKLVQDLKTEVDPTVIITPA